MKVRPDREKKQIVIEMTEKEWLCFEASMAFPILSPTDRTEETIAENATVEPETIESKDYTIPENAVLLSTAPQETFKPKKITPRVENLFPGFKKPEVSRNAFKGMLSIKCSCGKRNVLFSRDPITEITCKGCDATISFDEPLKRVDYECYKCGYTGYHFANHDDTTKVKCKMCGDLIIA